MFQNFDTRATNGKSTERVAALRQRLRQDGLTGYVVPHADEHQSEYLPPSAERLAWLTGFTGSAGTAIVLTDDAVVFVDGRYTLQAAKEVDADLFHIVDIAEATPSKWLRRNLKPGARIGYDPMLFTTAEVKRLEQSCREAESDLVPVETNLINALWIDRPDPPSAPISLHPIEFAGRSTADKLADIATILADNKVDAALLTQADSVAWTFNIRGHDVAHNPAPLATALIRAEGKPTLYVDGRKLSNTVRDALSDVADIAEPARLADDLRQLASTDIRLQIDRETAPSRFATIIADTGGQLVESHDPVALLKSRKNAAELAGARRAHLRDGIAMTRFLAWLDRESAARDLDEIACVEALERFRTEAAIADGTELVDISFDTIAGAGPNGAIVHYRVTRDSNRTLDRNSLFLVDSGAQYPDGTTDVTRTVAIGTPTEEMRTRFTLVLKGHIAVADARFPVGTGGTPLDTLARMAFWHAGLDYDHGTGHGVGSFLSVHEGPARISKTGNVALEPGMILSNEPGYYKAGAYGIRIENLVVVTEAEPIEGGERLMLGFETLTLAPIDRRLVNTALLTDGERDWLTGYHARVREALAPKLEGEDRAWLEAATAPIG
jgi:Xaa-Pro aminopeptidase